MAATIEKIRATEEISSAHGKATKLDRVSNSLRNGFETGFNLYYEAVKLTFYSVSFGKGRKRRLRKIERESIKSFSNRNFSPTGAIFGMAGYYATFGGAAVGAIYGAYELYSMLRH